MRVLFITPRHSWLLPWRSWECIVFTNPHKSPSPVLRTGSIKTKRLAEVNRLSDENRYNDHISAVLQECPGVDRDEVQSAFQKYEEEFFIPPQDAIRSIIRRFKSESESSPAASTSFGQTNRPTRKVNRLSELKADDRDIEIEVEIVSHNVREQMIRGESKSIAFGLLEDDPWQEGNQERNRWEYKDWGNNNNITPGSVVRIEGASVNEYQGRMSLNINQSSRIAVLREGSRPVVEPGEPIDISSLPSDGYVCVVGRLMSSRADQIHRRDGSGSIDVVRGRIADESGAIGFLSWEPFDYELGSLLKIDGAQVKTFRDTPELNFGRTTKIEPFHDANFADTESLKQEMVSTISTLRDGSKDVEIVVNITSWEKEPSQKTEKNAIFGQDKLQIQRDSAELAHGPTCQSTILLFQ